MTGWEARANWAVTTCIHMTRYSKERREAVLAKMAGPNRKTIPELEREEGISAATLYNWRKQARSEGRVLPESDDTPEGWGARDKFNAVLETAALSESGLAEYCRKRRLEREVNRKDKALAETAALLALRKKMEAIWGDNEDA